MYVCIIRMELGSIVRNKFYSTENVNLLKGVINQFLQEKHNVKLDENVYSSELTNVMSSSLNNSFNTNLYQKFRDSSTITKEINRIVISKVIPSIQNKLFKKVSVPPRPDSTKNNFENTYQNASFGDGFVHPSSDNLNMKPTPSFQSVEFPQNTSNNTFEKNYLIQNLF